MKTTVIALILLAATMTMVSAETNAAIDDNDKPIVSVTPYLGYGFWSKDLGLNDSFVYGARGGIHFLKWLSLEGTYGRSGSDQELDGTSVDLNHYGVDLVAELLPRAKFVPYITAGWSQLDYKADGADRTLPLNGAEVGVGLKTRLGGNNANYRALRLDIRDVMSNLTPDFPNEDKTTHNIVATLGVQFAFGKSSKDDDGDGIRNRDDDCPDTQAGAFIDASGCPSDSDGDGVYDGLDKCDGTPAHAKVGADGCPLDSDGDGIYDGLDKCPDTQGGTKVDANGCPLPAPPVKFEVLDIETLSTPKLNFDVESADLSHKNTSILDRVGAMLVDWPELKVEISGHADETGSAAYNQKLSEERAMTVRDYLKSHHSGILDSQIRTVGYGFSKPIADNNTEAGRAANRRVEFKVLNSGELKREVDMR